MRESEHRNKVGQINFPIVIYVYLLVIYYCKTISNLLCVKELYRNQRDIDVTNADEHSDLSYGVSFMVADCYTTIFTAKGQQVLRAPAATGDALCVLT